MSHHNCRTCKSPRLEGHIKCAIIARLESFNQKPRKALLTDPNEQMENDTHTHVSSSIHLNIAFSAYSFSKKRPHLCELFHHHRYIGGYLATLDHKWPQQHPHSTPFIKCFLAVLIIFMATINPPILWRRPGKDWPES